VSIAYLRPHHDALGDSREVAGRRAAGVRAVLARRARARCARGVGAAGKDFAFPLDAMLRAITPNTRIVYVNNPNNPSGQPIPKEAIHRIARRRRTRWSSLTRRITIFSARTSCTEAAAYPNVLIGRTFSKAFGLAGMRVGVMIASPEILAPIRNCMPLFNLNVVAVAALRAAIGDPSFPTWYSRRRTNRKQLVYAACERPA
jgi:histidinol-phosphate aminotransferase